MVLPGCVGIGRVPSTAESVPAAPVGGGDPEPASQATVNGVSVSRSREQSSVSVDPRRSWILEGRGFALLIRFEFSVFCKYGPNAKGKCDRQWWRLNKLQSCREYSFHVNRMLFVFMQTQKIKSKFCILVLFIPLEILC